MQKTLVIGAIALLSACSSREAPPDAPPQPPTAATPPTAPPAAAMPENVPASTAPTTSHVLGAEGIGTIRFGMTLAEAEQATGAGAERPTPFDPACSMVRFPALPKLRFMVESDKVTRADADAGVENAVGVAIGDTLAQVREKHPEAQVSTHKYDKNGHYVTFPTADGKAAIILEESGGKVTKVRAGLQPAVAYVETCG